MKIPARPAERAGGIFLLVKQIKNKSYIGLSYSIKFAIQVHFDERFNHTAKATINQTNLYCSRFVF